MVEFKIPIYGGAVRIYNNKQQYQVAHEEITDEEEMDLEGFAGITQKLEMEDNSTLYLVGIFDESVETLLHECTHIAIYISQHCGWEVNVETSEPFCYLLEEIFRLSKEAI